MKSASAAVCFDAGLFTILTVVLNDGTPGYQKFKSACYDAWRNLGFDDQAVTDLLALKMRGKATALRDGLRAEVPQLIERSWGDQGKSYYEIGFWCGMLILACIANLAAEMPDTVRHIKYSCADARNPQPLLDFVRRAEGDLDAGRSLDIAGIAAFTEEFHLWLMANVHIQQVSLLVDVIKPMIKFLPPVLAEIFGAFLRRMLPA